MKFLLNLAGAIGLLLASTHILTAQHGHLNAGALGPGQNDALFFDNGADFAASSGYVNTLTYTNDGRFAGYYQGNISLTVLPATAAHAGPEPHAPALGSFIQAQIACLEGPAGGSFGFWDAGSTSPSISVSPGQTSSNLLRLSESDGTPGSDPYGHIHGRRFTATRPGIYKVGFTLFDTSTNGTAGGPIHAPSEQLAIWFEAGVNVRLVEPGQEKTRVEFAAPTGWIWQLEASDTLGPNPTWTSVGRTVTGDDYFHELLDQHGLPAHRFYRLRGVIP